MAPAPVDAPKGTGRILFVDDEAPSPISGGRCSGVRDMMWRVKRVGIIGRSPQIVKSLTLVADAAVSEKEVLIVAETVTGKELFARAIHENSPRQWKRTI